MRLIDADALLLIFASKIKKITPIGYSRDAFHHDSGRNGAWVGARIEVNKAPTIDAVPVVHGYWKPMKAYKTECVCSECGELWPDWKSPYCPDCGAKMDGERKE